MAWITKTMVARNGFNPHRHEIHAKAANPKAKDLTAGMSGEEMAICTTGMLTNPLIAMDHQKTPLSPPRQGTPWRTA